jgi:hypothetical protein
MDEYSSVLLSRRLIVVARWVLLRGIGVETVLIRTETGLRFLPLTALSLAVQLPKPLRGWVAISFSWCTGVGALLRGVWTGTGIIAWLVRLILLKVAGLLVLVIKASRIVLLIVWRSPGIVLIVMLSFGSVLRLLVLLIFDIVVSVISVIPSTLSESVTVLLHLVLTDQR